MSAFSASRVRLCLVAAAVTIAGGVWAIAQEPARHAMRGMVLKVDPSRRSLVVSHDSIPGAMGAMTMRFEVADARELDGVEPGETITFTAVPGGGAAHAEHIHVVPYRSAEQDPLTARRLALLKAMTARSPEKPVASGAAVPDFTLTDQRRTRLSLSQLRGTVVALSKTSDGQTTRQFS